MENRGSSAREYAVAREIIVFPVGKFLSWNILFRIILNLLKRSCRKKKEERYYDTYRESVNV